MENDIYAEYSDPYYGDYGLVVNVKYYGIFSRKQAQRRIRHINRQLKLRGRRIKRMREPTGSDGLFSFVTSPQNYFNKISWQMKQIRTLRKMRNKIASRWNLTRTGKKKKGGGRFLFWKKKKLPKWLR